MNFTHLFKKLRKTFLLIWRDIYLVYDYFGVDNLQIKLYEMYRYNLETVKSELSSCSSCTDGAIIKSQKTVANFFAFKDISVASKHAV